MQRDAEIRQMQKEKLKESVVSVAGKNMDQCMQFIEEVMSEELDKCTRDFKIQEFMLEQARQLDKQKSQLTVLRNELALKNQEQNYSSINSPGKIRETAQKDKLEKEKNHLFELIAQLRTSVKNLVDQDTPLPSANPLSNYIQNLKQ